MTDTCVGAETKSVTHIFSKDRELVREPQINMGEYRVNYILLGIHLSGTNLKLQVKQL